jgi:hypothetical protein
VTGTATNTHRDTLRAWIGALWIPATLVLLTLLFMAPFVSPSTGPAALDGSDLVNQQYPLLSLIFDHVRDELGLPLWNPYQFAGQSIASNPQSSVFYPLAWVMVPLGVPRGVGWLVVLHLWLGGWGFAVFARRLGASSVGVLAGGIVYEFSATLAAHLGAGHFNYLLCQAWLPWMAAAYLWALDRRNWLAGLPGAAALGMCILAGYPPLVYLGGLWLAALGLYAALSVPTDRGRAAVRALRPLLVMGIGGVVLGAALLLPVGEFTLRSTRTENSLQFSNSYAMPAGQLLTLVIPNLFGYPRLPDHGYWGLPFYEELTAYLGIVPLVAVFRARRRPIVTLLVALFVLGPVVSLGIDGGLFSLLYYLLPGYRLFRVPPRALYLATVGGAGLTALFITDLQTLDHDGRLALLRPVVRWALPLVAAMLALAAFALLATYTLHSADDNPPWRLFFSANMTALAAVALGITWLGLRLWTTQDMPGRESGLAALTALIVLVDVWHISSPMVTASAVDVPEMWQAMARVAPASPDFRVMTVPDQVIWQAGATYTRHLNANGYDPLVGSAIDRLLKASQYNPTSPIARLLGVRYAISDRPFDWLGIPGIESVKATVQDGPWYIFELADPLPRAFVTPAVQVIPDDDRAVSELASGAIDPLAGAVVEKPVTCAPEASGGTAEVAQASEAEIVRYTPNEVDLATHADQPGVLVLTDTYDPNWTVTVDGARADLLRVYTALRGVCVPAGTHRVHFEYRPVSLVAGAVVSGVGWLALGGIGLVCVARRARRITRGRDTRGQES